jgi:hypothetical protein
MHDAIPPFFSVGFFHGASKACCMPTICGNQSIAAFELAKLVAESKSTGFRTMCDDEASLRAEQFTG